ncbi:hypothetical protein HYW39_01010, partial [Candidatus Curtissbacteria bacterium]|nr:hypothetical protein [Candidatus Curtissbacteria bacterium]
MSSLKIFRVDGKVVKKLTKNERKILPLLISAAKKIDKIFKLQENDRNKGANFYPQDATRENIEQAAKDDPKILSPFTVVKRDSTGKLKAIDYHIEYSKRLTFKNYLESLSSSLVTGAYQQADVAWLSVKNSNIDVIIGPHERYLDKLFFIKRAYQACVGVVDHDKTKNAKFIRDILYTTTGPRPHRISPPSIVDMQVQRCLIFSGFLARAMFSRQHLPSDAETTERYGSRILEYVSVLDYKFEKLLHPIFNATFEKSFRKRYSKEILRKGNFYYVLLS